MTQTAADPRAPSTETGTAGRTGSVDQAAPGTPDRSVRGVVRPSLTLGDIVLVRLDVEIQRPMIVTALGADGRLSGTIFADPADHATPAFRGQLDTQTDPARILGRPDRSTPFGYGESLTEGSGIGQWTARPTRLPAGG